MPVEAKTQDETKLMKPEVLKTYSHSSAIIGFYGLGFGLAIIVFENRNIK